MTFSFEQSTDAVLRELAARSVNGSDGHSTGCAQRKIALVVEGGAMRGVISMAFLTALHRHGMVNSFDRVFAASAGAINAAYFLAGQAETGLAFYLKEMNSARLLRKWRPWNMLDLEGIFEKIRRGSYSLDCEKLRVSRTRMDVLLTESKSGDGVAFPLQGSDDRIYNILTATSAIVPYSNKAIRLDGRRFLDGGIGEPIPIQRAVEAGCTHILILLTRPANYQPRRLSYRERFLLGLAVLPRTAQFRHSFLHERPGRYHQARAIAFGRSDAPGPVNISAIAPPETLRKISRFGNDPAVLAKVAQDCVDHAFSFITQYAPR